MIARCTSVIPGTGQLRFRCRIVFSLLVLVHVAAAQDLSIADESKKNESDSIRSRYISGFPDHFFLYPVLKQRGLNFELSNADRSSKLTYRPNNTYSLGLGMYLFELGVEIAFAIPLREQSIDRFGRSDARDLQLNVLAKRWGADLFSQNYSGFYIDDSQVQVLQDEAFPQRQDIGIKNFGLTGHYVFNHERFSLRSAYNYAERQLSTKGSFILLGTLSTFRIAADSSIVIPARRPDFGSEADFTRLRYTTFSVAPGYAFNLTYNNFFLNTTLALGPAHHWLNYDLEGQRATQHDIAVNTFFGARVAIGYNGSRLFGGVSFVSQGTTLGIDRVNFSSSNSVFKVLMGYRFREWGILRKRVWDIVPFISP